MKGYASLLRASYLLTLSTSQYNVNVRTALGSPAVAGDVSIIVPSGVVIGSTSILSPALRLGRHLRVGRGRA